jgi:hypothetical protein
MVSVVVVPLRLFVYKVDGAKLATSLVLSTCEVTISTAVAAEGEDIVGLVVVLLAVTLTEVVPMEVWFTPKVSLVLLVC